MFLAYQLRISFFVNCVPLAFIHSLTDQSNLLFISWKGKHDLFDWWMLNMLFDDCCIQAAWKKCIYIWMQITHEPKKIIHLDWMNQGLICFVTMNRNGIELLCANCQLKKYKKNPYQWNYGPEIPTKKGPYDFSSNSF